MRCRTWQVESRRVACGRRSQVTAAPRWSPCCSIRPPSLCDKCSHAQSSAWSSLSWATLARSHGRSMYLALWLGALELCVQLQPVWMKTAEACYVGTAGQQLSGCCLGGCLCSWLKIEMSAPCVLCLHASWSWAPMAEFVAVVFYCLRRLHLTASSLDALVNVVMRPAQRLHLQEDHFHRQVLSQSYLLAPSPI